MVRRGTHRFKYKSGKELLLEFLHLLNCMLILIDILLQGVNYVMCLDTLAASDSIYMHVSKPPNSTAAPGAVVFMDNLKATAERHTSVSFDLIHKRIHLREILLPWEHERYSLKRVHAFTLSSLKNHKDPYRRTILDTSKNFNIDRLVQNTQFIAEALAGFVYNVSDGNVFGGTLVSEDFNLLYPA